MGNRGLLASYIRSLEREAITVGAAHSEPDGRHFYGLSLPLRHRNEVWTMSRKLTAASLALALLAFAEPIHTVNAAGLDSCKADAERICPGITPGGGKLIGCLERAQGRSEYRLCKDAKRDQRKDGQVTAKKECKREGPGASRVTSNRISGCPYAGWRVVLQDAAFSICAARWSSECASPNVPQIALRSASPTGSLICDRSPALYFPTIETSAANAHSQTMVAQPRSIELARRARLREYCRARLHCRGVSPPGLARRCQGRFR